MISRNRISDPMGAIVHLLLQDSWALLRSCRAQVHLSRNIITTDGPILDNTLAWVMRSKELIQASDHVLERLHTAYGRQIAPLPVYETDSALRPYVPLQNPGPGTSNRAMRQAVASIMPSKRTNDGDPAIEVRKSSDRRNSSSDRPNRRSKSANTLSRTPH